MLNSEQRRGSSNKRAAKNELHLAKSGLRIKKILRAHHSRSVYDFLKKNAEKNTGTDERTAPNKNKMGKQTRANLPSCAFFSTNVPTGFKTRIRKSSREVESNLKKDGRKKKNESTMGEATIM